MLPLAWDFRRCRGSRFFLGVLLTAALGASTLALAPPKIDPRRKVWEADAGSFFTQQRNGTWTETGLKGQTFQWTPVETNDDYIELFDKNRKFSARLFADRYELKVGEGEFKLFRKGHWRAAGKPAPKPKTPLTSTATIGAQPTPPRVAAGTRQPVVRLFYFVPQDRNPIDRYAERIRVVMDIANEVYQTEFRRRGWKATGLRFERDAKNEMVVHLVRGKLNAADYNGAPNYDRDQQWNAVKQELSPPLGNPRQELVVVLMETYDPGPAEVEWPGGVALGGQFTADGGLGIFSAWILKDEFTAENLALQKQLFRDATSIVGRKARGSALPNSPRFEFIEDGYGAVIHEVGHALGLPHDHREPSSIMGNGFRILARNFDPAATLGPRATFTDLCAMLLHSSRFLNPDLDFTDEVPPQVVVQGQDAGSGPVMLAIQATDDRALNGAVIFDVVEDSIVTGEPISGRQYYKTVSLPLKRNPQGRVNVRVLVVDNGGHITRIAYP